MSAEPKLVGRPPEPVPQDIADALCDWIAEGKPLRAFCRQPGMPAWRTVYAWMEFDPEFRARVARARDFGFPAIAEEALEIADTPQIGTITTVDDGEKGGTKTTTEDMLGHRKLQVETRLKLLACWDPKRYGQKQQLEHSGSIDLGLAERMRKADERLKEQGGQGGQ